MLASIEEAFQYCLQSKDGTEYRFYRKGESIYYDFDYQGRTLKTSRYSGTEEELFHIIKHFVPHGLNPYHFPTSGNPVIDKMKEMELRFANKKARKPAKAHKVAYVSHYT